MGLGSGNLVLSLLKLWLHLWLAVALFTAMAQVQSLAQEFQTWQKKKKKKKSRVEWFGIY